MEKSLSQFNDYIKEINNDLDYGKESKEDFEKLHTILKKAEEQVKIMERLFYDMTIEKRNDYKRVLNSSKATFTNLKNIIEKKERHLRKEEDLKLKGNLLINQNTRYEKANDQMSFNIKISNETRDNMKLGINELRKQQGKMEENIKQTEHIEESLSLHDQFFALTRNRAMYNKLKLFFIVFMFFLGDMLMLFFKLKR